MTTNGFSDGSQSMGIPSSTDGSSSARRSRSAAATAPDAQSSYSRRTTPAGSVCGRTAALLARRDNLGLRKLAVDARQATTPRIRCAITGRVRGGGNSGTSNSLAKAIGVGQVDHRLRTESFVDLRRRRAAGS